MIAEFWKKSMNSESTITNTILHNNYCIINTERESQHLSDTQPQVSLGTRLLTLVIDNPCFSPLGKFERESLIFSGKSGRREKNSFQNRVQKMCFFRKSKSFEANLYVAITIYTVVKKPNSNTTAYPGLYIQSGGTQLPFQKKLKITKHRIYY